MPDVKCSNSNFGGPLLLNRVSCELTVELISVISVTSSGVEGQFLFLHKRSPIKIIFPMF